MARFKNSSVDIHYEVAGAGSGPWVTLVNGHTRASSDFRQFVRFLVAKDYRVLVFDNRGAGETITNGDFTLDEMVDDIAALHEHEGIGSSHMLGISMGGMICQRFAELQPDELRSMVLVSTAQDPKFIRTDDSDWPKTVEAVAERLRTYFAPNFASRNEALISMMAKQMLKNLEDGGLQIGARRQRAAIRSFGGANLARLDVPTLVIHGELDSIIPIEEARRLAKALPVARLDVFEGCGHLILAEMPKRLYEVAVRFFEQADGRTA